MVKPKTDNERRYDAAKDTREEAEKAAQAAERVTTGHPPKIESKRRQLRNLKNTISSANDEQNSRSNRHSKKIDLEFDLDILENELRAAKQTLSNARAATQIAREDEVQAAAAFTIERDRALLDNNERKLELDEQKFALAEREKAETAKTRLEEARLKGANDKEILLLEAKATAAQTVFEWQQRFELEAKEANNRTHEISLQGDIAEKTSKLNHDQALEVINANEVSDVARIVATATEHRKNVTHEINEDVRKALQMLPVRLQEGTADTLNAAKLMIIKHYLHKDDMSHTLKIGQHVRNEEIKNVAADMAEIAKWNSRSKTPKSNLDDGSD